MQSLNSVDICESDCEMTTYTKKKVKLKNWKDIWRRNKIQGTFLIEQINSEVSTNDYDRQESKRKKYDDLSTKNNTETEYFVEQNEDEYLSTCTDPDMHSKYRKRKYKILNTSYNGWTISHFNTQEIHLNGDEALQKGTFVQRKRKKMKFMIDDSDEASDKEKSIFFDLDTSLHRYQMEQNYQYNNLQEDSNLTSSSQDSSEKVSKKKIKILPEATASNSSFVNNKVDLESNLNIGGKLSEEVQHYESDSNYNEPADVLTSIMRYKEETIDIEEMKLEDFFENNINNLSTNSNQTSSDTDSSSRRKIKDKNGTITKNKKSQKSNLQESFESALKILSDSFDSKREDTDNFVSHHFVNDKIVEDKNETVDKQMPSKKKKSKSKRIEKIYEDGIRENKEFMTTELNSDKELETQSLKSNNTELEVCDKLGTLQKSKSKRNLNRQETPTSSLVDTFDIKSEENEIINGSFYEELINSFNNSNSKNKLKNNHSDVDSNKSDTSDELVTTTKDSKKKMSLAEDENYKSIDPFDEDVKRIDSNIAVSRKIKKSKIISERSNDSGFENIEIHSRMKNNVEIKNTISSNSNVSKTEDIVNSCKKNKEVKNFCVNGDPSSIKKIKSSNKKKTLQHENDSDSDNISQKRKSILRSILQKNAAIKTRPTTTKKVFKGETESDSDSENTCERNNIPLEKKTNPSKSKNVNYKNEMYSESDSEEPNTPLRKLEISLSNEITPNTTDTECESSVSEDYVDINTKVTLKDQSSITENEADILKSLNIQLNFEVCPLHKILVRVSKPSSEEFAMVAEAGIPVKTGQFTKAEDEIIVANWNRFVEEYNLDIQPQAFFKPKRLRLNQRILFLRYLAQGLNDRLLHRVYSRFQLIFRKNFVKEGRFTKQEDKIILQISSSDTSHKSFKQVANLLNRHLKSIYTRYELLTRKDKTSIKCTIDLADKLVNIMLKVTKCKDYQDLKDLQFTMNMWRKISKKMDSMPIARLKKTWFLVCRPRLFTDVTTLAGVKRQIVDRLYTSKVDDLRIVNWNEIAEGLHDLPPSKVYEIFRKLVYYYVPEDKRNKFKESVCHLKETFSSDIFTQYNRKLPKWTYKNGHVQKKDDDDD